MHFVLSRAVLGTGYGLTLMACQGFVVRATDTRSTARGLAQLFAGIYGGSICGGVAGAILAERFGFGPVFAASGIIVFGVRHRSGRRQRHRKHPRSPGRCASAASSPIARCSR